MTEADVQIDTEPAPKASTGEAAYGQSFGAIAWDRYRRHGQAVAGTLIILFIAGCAVFAPLLANHLPYYVEARRPDRYENAFGIVWFDLYRAIEEVGKNSGGAFSDDLRTNVRENLTLMGELLGPDDRTALEPVAAQILAGLAASPVDAEALLATLEDNEERFDSFNADLGYSIILGYPALRNIKAAELIFMILYLALFVFVPLRRRMGGIRLAIAAALGLAFAGAAIWSLVVPGRHDPTDYKALEANGFIDRIAYPPVPYGENENIFDDAKMKPVWMQMTPDEAAARQQREFDAAMAAYRRAREAPGGDDAEFTEPKLEDFAPRPAEVTPYWRTDADGEPISLAGRPLYRRHWLGADATGRDLLARMIYGSRIAMSIGIVAVAIYVSIGVFIGASAGYFGSWVDLAVSRFIEIIICFPTFFLVLIIISFIGPSIFWVMVVIGITGWTSIARLTRGEFLRVGTLDFVQAVRGAGGSNVRIVARHILPNAIQPVLVSASFGIASAILIESALSYLGFGVRPPDASWGVLLHDAQDDVKGMWWMTIFPGMAIFTTVTAFNLCGEALRDALDPKLIGGE